MLTLLSLALIADAPPEQPNIVFIMADDLGYGDLGCFGSTKIRTPNIDALAARGMRLTRHYAGNAVCAPSRCVLMTGLHPGHCEIRSNGEISPEGQWPIADDTVTVAERLKELGYATGAFGKWGLGGPYTVGEPLRQGFDRFYGYNCQRIAHNFFPTSLWSDRDVVPLANRGFSAYGKLGPDDDPGDPASYERFTDADYSADLIAGQAVAFVDAHADEPFFLYHPTTIPHLALQAPAETIASYADDPAFADDPPYVGGNGYLPAFRPHATYAAMVTRMDEHVGQIVAALERNRLLDRTVIVFTSDNGPAYRRLGGTDTAFFDSHGGLRGRKGDLYEGGIRVPTVVAGPGITQGESDTLSGFEDWTPTLVAIAGGDVPDDVDGVSLVPTLTGQPQPSRGPMYREFPSYGGQQAVWDGDWKLYRGDLNRKARQNAPLEWELYDLSSDPNESDDVAGAHPDVVERLAAFAESAREPSSVFPFPALDR